MEEKFDELFARQGKLRRRDKIYNVGTNDADYRIEYKSSTSGKRIVCPYYKKWKSLLQRCYSEVYHKKRPTYIGCTVCDEWLVFSTFKEWMVQQDWQGMQLDKDLLYFDNKIYSSKTCVFVDSKTNSLLTDCSAARGDYPQGVNWHKRHEKFVARVSVDGKSQHLGYFLTYEEAEAVYKKAKSSEIYRVAQLQTDLRVKVALELRSHNLVKEVL